MATTRPLGPAQCLSGGFFVFDSKNPRILNIFNQADGSGASGNLVRKMEGDMESSTEESSINSDIGVSAGGIQTRKGTAELDEQLGSIFKIVKSRTDCDFSSYKKNTVIRRIERRMMKNGISGIRDYISALEQSTREARALCQEFFIGVTSFFRDPEAFEALRKEVLPDIFGNRDAEVPVRIWIAGCSTGE